MNYKLVAYAQDFVSFLLQSLKSDSAKIRQIILFGSVARGDEEKSSDIDLFVEVVDSSLEDKVHKLRDAFYSSVKVKKYWALLGVTAEINCTVGKLEEWEDLHRSIIANGIVLYGRYLGKPDLKPYYFFSVIPCKSRRKNILVWRKLYGYRQKVGKKVYGRKGLVKEVQGSKLAQGLFIIPAESSEILLSFLKKKKLRYQMIPLWKEN
ncbi:nucleotidyltransferase domain-containing protein [Candidatus Woesearchaeota archaeon]|nr:nucleotidyltransferase domain-containing protein [Candidatus Woesearchaeota archaeon]